MRTDQEKGLRVGAAPARPSAAVRVGRDGSATLFVLGRIIVLRTKH
jgi:hypothetical protein